MNHLEEFLLKLSESINTPKQDDPTEELETVPSYESVGLLGTTKPLSPVKLSNIFRHPKTHPIALDMLLLMKYGPEFLIWEAETLEYRIPMDFKVDAISDLNMSKIQALKTLHLVDSYWKQWEVFNWCTASLNSLFPDFEIMQVPTVAQCLISCDIANRLRDDVSWSEEVKAFISAAFKFDGVLCPIEPCEFISLDLSDYLVDCKRVQEQWPQVRDSKKPPQEETVEAEQLRRILIVYEQLQDNRKTLREQLKVVENAQ